jgi:hypothetical protein
MNFFKLCNSHLQLLISYLSKSKENKVADSKDVVQLVMTCPMLSRKIPIRDLKRVAMNPVLRPDKPLTRSQSLLSSNALFGNIF